MAVYEIEVPDEISKKYTPSEIETILRVIAFDDNIKVRHKSSGTFKDVDWQAEYDVIMGAG